MAQRVVQWGQILWPAFLVAGVLEMVVFSVVDPGALHLGGWSPGANAVYTIAFFVFWALVAGASYLSLWLASGPAPEAEPSNAHHLAH
jgi:hypothetical protein